MGKTFHLQGHFDEMESKRLLHTWRRLLIGIGFHDWLPEIVSVPISQNPMPSERVSEEAKKASVFSRILAGIMAVILGALSCLMLPATVISGFFWVNLLGLVLFALFSCRAVSNKRHGLWNFMWIAGSVIFSGVCLLVGSFIGQMILGNSEGFRPEGVALFFVALAPWLILVLFCLAGLLSELRPMNGTGVQIQATGQFNEY